MFLNLLTANLRTDRCTWDTLSDHFLSLDISKTFKILKHLLRSISTDLERCTNALAVIFIVFEIRLIPIHSWNLMTRASQKILTDFEKV